MTIGLKLAPTNLDIRNTAGSALDQILIGNVYEGIVARDSKNQVAPAIASSWETSKDGLTYTFHLNKNMTFFNGDKLDAEDVAWSINELIAKATTTRRARRRQQGGGQGRRHRGDHAQDAELQPVVDPDRSRQARVRKDAK